MIIDFDDVTQIVKFNNIQVVKHNISQKLLVNVNLSDLACISLYAVTFQCNFYTMSINGKRLQAVLSDFRLFYTI